MDHLWEGKPSCLADFITGIIYRARELVRFDSKSLHSATSQVNSVKKATFLPHSANSETRCLEEHFVGLLKFLSHQYVRSKF